MIDRFFSVPLAVGALMAFALASASTSVSAQSGADLIYLQDRVERLEAMVQLYGGGASGPPDGDSSSGAALSMRIGQVEEQMRHLNGRIEEMSHMIHQLEDRLRRFSEDTEYRLRGSDGDIAMDWQSSRSTGPGQQSHGAADPDRPVEGGMGEPPRILGQVPGQPLDLSGAFDTPGGFGQPVQPPQGGTGDGGTQLAAVPLTGDPRDDYDMAYGYILRGDFSTAESGFRQFLAHYPDNELAGNAQYWLGESLFARARYRDAADAFLAGYTEHPENAKAPDSLFKLGMSLKELGQREAACATLGEIGRRFPDAPQAVRERARNELEKSGC